MGRPAPGDRHPRPTPPTAATRSPSRSRTTGAASRWQAARSPSAIRRLSRPDGFGRTVTSGLGTADVGGAWSTNGSSFAVNNGQAVVSVSTAGQGSWDQLAGVSSTATDLTAGVRMDKLVNTGAASRADRPSDRHSGLSAEGEGRGERVGHGVRDPVLRGRDHARVRARPGAHLHSWRPAQPAGASHRDGTNNRPRPRLALDRGRADDLAGHGHRFHRRRCSRRARWACSPISRAPRPTPPGSSGSTTSSPLRRDHETVVRWQRVC